MPVISRDDLLGRLREAAEAGGWSLVIERAIDHPFMISLLKDDQTIRLYVYIWNLTHGGGLARPADEMRIQMTSVTPPLEAAADRITLLLGWNEDMGVFAGFDVDRHRQFTEGSPSVQIRLKALEEARMSGLGFAAKGNGEVAVAFLPPLLIEYIEHAREWHGVGDEPRTIEMLTTAAAGGGIPDEELVVEEPERARVFRTINQLHRKHDFRLRVLSAYGHRCAACSIQLNLVDAAHIVPVAHASSSDATSNGLALCSLHHRGYDSALLGVDEAYQVLVSDGAVARLVAVGFDGGLDAFRAGLRSTIVLPADHTARPRPDFLRLGLQVRGWAA